MATKRSTKRRKAITRAGNPSEISPEAELIASNVDLLTEIFLCLPAKSLIRFKCVSKHWLSLISDSQFATNHSTRNPRPSISGLYFYSGGLKSVSLYGHRNLPSLSFLDGIEGNVYELRILNSCNGLLLCKTGFECEPIYIVCNSTTQKYKVVKPSGLSSRSALHRGAYLAFDPSKSPHYKVVVGSHYNRSKLEPWSFEIDMFDSETGNWKKILPLDTCSGRGVFLEGAIHWLSKSHRNVLLRFNIDAEEMTALPLSPFPRILSKSSIKYFGECGGRLILIQTSSNSAMGFPFLELESDTGQIMKYWVDRRTILSAFPKMENLFEFYVLCVVKDEKKEDYALVLAIPGKLISYCLKCHESNVLCNLEPDELIIEGVNGCAFPFLETLSPV